MCTMTFVFQNAFWLFDCMKLDFFSTLINLEKVVQLKVQRAVNKK